MATIFLARDRDSKNPKEKSEISAIMAKSGIIMATGLNSTFKLSGSSERPAYVGFMVMKMLVVDMRTHELSSKLNLLRLLVLALWISKIC